VAAFFSESARGQNVTYTLNGSITSGSASWSQTGTWTGGVVANGAANTADFSENLLTGNLTITLDGNQTIGSLFFGDTGAKFNTTLAVGTGGALTLSVPSGSPVIDVVNETATISVGIAGTSGLNKTGTGNLILTGANTYTGTTTVTGGTLTLDFSQAGSPASNIIGGTSPASVALTGDATLTIKGGAGLSNSQNFGSLTVGSGADIVTLTLNGATNLTAALGTITQTTGGTLDFSVAPLISGVVATTTNSVVNGILGPWATVGTGASTQYATINGSGQIVAYTGATAGGANLVSVTNATANYTYSAAATLGGARTANTLQYTGGATTMALGANTLTLNGLLDTGSGLLTITSTGAGGIVIGATKELDILGSGSVTISAPVANNAAGASSLTYSGAGTLTLGVNASTYTGTTTVNSGTVTLSLANVLNSASSLVVNGGTLGISTFVQSVSGVSLIGGSITGTTGGSLTSASAFNLQNGTVSAILAGSAGITKTTAGTVTISAVGTVTGGVAIKAGTLKIGVNQALGANLNSVTLGDSVANTGGTLDLNGKIQEITTLLSAGSGQSLITNSSTTAATLELVTAGTNFGGVIQDGASVGGVALTLFGGGTGTFTGANTYTGLTTIQNYNLTLSGGNNRLSANDSVDLNNNGVLHLGSATAASNQTLSSLIVGSMGTVNRVVGGDAAQTSTLTINNSTADPYQSYLGSGTADTTMVTAANDLALTKTGVGTLTLGGGGLITTLSTYDGGTNVNQGTLALGVTNALPASRTLTFNGGTLTSGAVSINGGTLDLAGFSSVAGPVTLTSGSIVDSVGGGVLSGSSYTVQSGAVGAVLGGAGVSLTKTTGGIVTLSGVNTYTGGTNVDAGTLILGAADTLSASGTVSIIGGTLALGAPNGLAAGGAVNVNGGALDLAGFSSTAGAVTLTTGSIVNSGGASTLSAGSYTVQSGAVSAVLGGAISPMTKTGSGTVTLTGANTYGGATTVSGGILDVSATQTGAGAFSVNDGAALGVDLTAAGQTLNTSSLTLGSATGASITLSLGTFGNTTAPVINTGSLTLNGTDVVNISGGGLSVGEFPLIAYTGSIGGSGSLAVGTLPARITATLDMTSIPNLVQLDVTAYDYPKWTGAVNGNWDVDPTGAGQQGTLNWVTAISGVATRYLQGTGGTDSVLFDDSAAATATVSGGATTVNLTTTLTPVSVTVNNSVLNYIFSGPGALSGTTGLLKEGSGTLTIANTGGNNYTGTTTISAGTVQVGDGSTPGAGQLGSGAVVIDLGGSLVLDRPSGDNITVANAISGAGALVQNGGDTVTLTGNNLSFSGTFNVTAGTLTVGSANALGTAGGSVGSGATLDVTGFSISNALTVDGGFLQASSGAGSVASGPVTLSGGGNANVLAGATLTISGAIGGSGGFATNGSGLLILTGSNTYSGGTTINAGTLQIGAGGVSGTLGSGGVTDNGTLAFDRIDSYGGPVSNMISGTGALTLSAGTLTLSGANTYTGVTNIDGGILNAAVFGSVNTASSFGAGSAGGSAADLAFGGGTLQYTGTSAASTNRLFTIGDAAGNSATIDSSATSAADSLIFSGAGGIAFVNTVAHTLTLTGSNTGANTFAPVISDLSAAYKTSLIKSGAGTWTISGANTFTGGVTVQAGTLMLGVSEALGNDIDTLTLGNSVTNTGGTLDLNGKTQILTTLFSAGTGQNLITNSSPTAGTLELVTAGSIFGGVIQDGASVGGVSVTLAGGGTATFTGANTYTGLTIVQNYNLTLTGGNNRLSTSDAVELNNNGVLHLGDSTGASNQTVSSLTVGTNTLNRVVGGNATQTSTLTINNSVADLYQSYLGSGAADTTMVTNLNDLALTKTGAGTLTLGGGATSTLSTYDGGTNVNQGTLALGIANALPAAVTLPFNGGTLTSGAVNINGGTLDLAGFSSVAGAVTLTSGSIVDSGAAATLSGSSYTVQSGIISAVLGDGTTPSALTKTAAGTVTLSGANTYTGGTNVDAGTLVLGAANALAATGAVNIAGGTLNLEGFSSAAGAVSLTSGSIVDTIGGGALIGSSYNLQSGAVSAVLGGASSALTKTGSGTVTLSAANSYGGATVVSAGVLNVSATQTGGGAISVSDGAALGVDLTAVGQTLIASSLTLGNATGASITLSLGTFGSQTAAVINIGSLTLNGTDLVNISGAGLSVGEFPLIAYTGSIGGSGSLAVGTLPARMVATLDTTSVPNLVQLDVTAYDYPKWTGAVNGNWDLDPTGTGQQGTLNWQTAISGVATRNLQGTGGTDSLLFDDSAAATATVVGGATTVNLTTTLTPVSVTVNNSALNYIFSGPGALSGSTGLLKEGSGTLTLTNTGGNNYTGATTISAGTLQVGDGSTPGAGQLGAGAVVISVGGTLVLDRPLGDDITVSNAISGAGALVQNGQDDVTLTGNNLSFNGSFNVTAGTLTVGSVNALGTAAGSVGSGGTLDVSGFSINNALAVNGGGLQDSSGVAGNVSGPVTLNGSGIGNVAAGATLTISGSIGGGGGLAKNGGGILILSGSNSYGGATTINGGTLQIGAGGFSGTLGGGTVTDNGTLTFDRVDNYGGAVNNTISGNGGITLDSGTLILAGTNSYAGVTNILGGTLQIGAGGVSGTLGSGAVTDNGTLAFDRTDSYGGAVSNMISGTGGLTLSAGTLLLSGANTYTGLTVIAGGTLQVGNSNALGSGADSAVVATGGTLDLAGYFIAEPLQIKGGIVTSSSGVSGGVSAAVALSGSGTLDAPASGVVSFTGPISGTGTLTKTSGGTVILSGANSFTGNVTITVGIIDITNSEALGIGPKVISVANANRPSLELDGSGGAIALDPSISFSMSSDGTEGTAGAIVNLAGNNTINGVLSMMAGGGGFARVQSLGGTLTLAGGVNANGSSGVRTLLIGGSANGIISGVIADGVTNGVSEQVSISKDGSGTWTLTAANTYSGSTVVDSGTVVVSGAGALNTSAISVYSGALFELDNTGTNSSSRISSPVTLYGGSFEYLANSSGSSETAASLTLGSGGAAIIMGGGSGSLTFSSFSSVAGSTMNLSIPWLGSTNLILFGTTPKLTNGILPRVTVTNGAGFDFATYNATNGLTAFAGYNGSTTTDINLAGATDTVEVTSSYGATTLNASKTLNALAINGNGLTVSGVAGSTLTLTSGGVLVTGGSDTISVPVLAFAATEGILSVNAGSILTLGSAITGTVGFSKADGGSVTLTAASFDTGTTTLNGGSLTLGAGGNSLYSGSALTVNGGTLELNGNSQYTGVLSSGSNISGVGGIIDNASATTSTFATNSGTGLVYFGGELTGNIFFSRAAGSTTAAMSLTNNNTYTGGTLLTGGVTTLIDQGTLSGTSSIAINYATLSINNTGTVNLTNRLPDNAPITMEGGTLSFLGRPETASTETVGVVTLMGGMNTINAANGGTAVNSADLTLSGFSRTASSEAVVNFTGTNLGTGGSNSRINISGATGASLGLVNNILPWAVVNGADFASYIPYTSANGVSAGGVGALSAAGYAGYDNTNLPGASAPAQNVLLSATQSVPAGGITINSLNLSGDIALNFTNSTDTLNLFSGGLLKSGGVAADYIGGQTPGSGNLTAGGAQSSGVADLYLFNGQAALIVNSAVINNPNGAAVRLVISAAAAADTTTLGFSSPNSPSGTGAPYSLYSGGLVVNSGTVSMNGTLPGGSITLNGATFNTALGSAFSSNPVFTLNNSTLNLFTAVTLAGLSFNSSGSNGNVIALQNSGATLTLPSDGSGITSMPTSVATSDIATINSASSSAFLNLNGTAQTFTVYPTLINGVNMAPVQAGLNINTAIVIDGGTTPGSIVLTGGGVLQLTNVANTFTGGVDVQGGSSLIIGGSSTPTGNGSVVTAGPVGTGILTLENGATLLSTAATNTLANSVVFNSDGGAYTFNGPNSLTLTGNISLPDSLSIDVVNPAMTATLAGTIVDGTTPGGTITIEKLGLGALVLNSSFTGTVISGGGALSFLSDGAAPDLGTSDPQVVLFSSTVNLAGATTINIGRLGTSLLPEFATASNKTISLPAFSLNGNALTVNNANGYGLLISSDQVLSGAQSFSVLVASASNAIPGLTITGALSGTGSINKLGVGTLALSGANSFVGSINIGAGILGAVSDGALGDPGNAINIAGPLGTAAAAPVGIEAFGGFSTNRTVNLVIPTVNATTASNSNIVTVSGVVGLYPGEQVIGAGIPAGTTIASINGNSVTLSQNATASGSTGLGVILIAPVITVNTTSASTSVTVPSTASLAVGQQVFGTGIPVGATITAITNGTTFTLSAAATATATGVNATVVNMSDAIEVASGDTLTLNSAFGAGSGSFIKLDDGTLAINASNASWLGQTIISGGAVQLQNSAALGSIAGLNNTTVLNFQGAALQLADGINVAEPLNLSNTGINLGGSLESVAGNNTYSGAITLNNAAAIGADGGSTLNITGGISGAQTLTFSGAGTIDITGTALGAVTSVTKIGAGTASLQVASTGFVGAVAVNGGTLSVSGSGAIGSTGRITLNPGSVLILDDTATAIATRLSGRPMSFIAGSLDYLANLAGSNETVGVPTFSRGLSTIDVEFAPGAPTGNATLTFGAQANNVAPVQTSAPSGAAVVFEGANLLSSVTTGKATIASTGAGFLFDGATGATSTTNKGILPWALVVDSTTGNVSFATADAAAAATGTTTNALRGLSASEMVSDTFAVNGQNVDLQTSDAIASTNSAAAVTVNSLTFETGQTLTLNGFQTLSNSSGGVLVKTGNATITGGVLVDTSATAPLTIWTYDNAVNSTSSSLTIDSVMTGGAGQASADVGLVKAGAGTLTITSPLSDVISGMSANTMTGQTVIAQGTIVLSGGTNTLSFDNTLEISPGGTLNLNGTSQMVYALLSDGAVVNGGGTVTGGANANSLLLANYDDNTARSFAGVLTGDLSFVRSGSAQIVTFYSNSDYSGSTLLTGGTLQLFDSAQLSQTSSLTIDFAGLTINNTGTMYLSNRVNDAAPITLTGGQITFDGRAQTLAAENLGAVTVGSGLSTILAVAGGTGINSATLTLAGLTQSQSSTSGGTDGTLLLGSSATSAAALGLIGSSANILISGASPASLTSAGVLINNIIPWAITASNEFASYNATYGFGGLGQTGFAGYDATTFPTANGGVNPTFNIKAAGTLPGLVNVNTLTLSGSVSFGGNVLNLTAGGIINNVTTSPSLGSGIGDGLITAGGQISTPTSGQDLYIYNRSGTLTINASVVDNNGIPGATGQVSNPMATGNTPIRLVLTVAGGNMTLTGVYSGYTGGTVINGGSSATGTVNLAQPVGYLTSYGFTYLIPAAGGLTINDATVTEITLGDNIDPATNVTLDGSASLNLLGNNTLNNVVFKNDGGSPTNATQAALTSSTGYMIGSVINSNGATTASTLPMGVLTINGSITSTSSNVGTVSTLAGRIILGANTTIDAEPILIDEQNVAPLEASLAIQSILSGGFTKTGAGALQLNAQDLYAGATNITAGMLNTGVNNAGSPFSALTLATGSILNLDGFNTVWGSLSGSGTVFNSIASVSTLTVGYDNTSTFFSGAFSRNSDALPADVSLTKIGAGTLTLTGVANITPATLAGSGSTGTLTVAQGAVTYSGAGTGAFQTNTVLTGGELLLDNTAANVNNRLNGSATSGSLLLSGGTFAINGNSTASTTETIGTFTLSNGFSAITLNANASQSLSLIIGTLSAPAAGGTLLLEGVSASGGSGSATVSGTNIVFTSQGGGANGTTTMSVRPDILGDLSATGSGTAFVVEDSVTGDLRPLTTAEMATTLTNAATTNFSLSSTAGIASSLSANTISLQAGGGVNLVSPAAYGLPGTNGGLSTLTLTTGGILAFSGNTGINVGALASTNTGYYLWAMGSGTALSITGNLVSAQGLTESGGGVVSLNSAEFYTGSTSVNNSTLILNGGNNTLEVTTSGTTPTVGAVSLNGSAALLDLNGNNQVIGALSSSNPLPNAGGTITNSSTTTQVTLAEVNAAASAFGGVISGNLNCDKYGAGTLVLSSANNYSGATIVGGGILTLQASGALNDTSAIRVNYGTLQIDNGGLSAPTLPPRFAPSVPVTLQGGTFEISGGGSLDTDVTINTLTMLDGQSTITLQPLINQGSTVTLNIGNLVHTSNESLLYVNGYVGASAGATFNTSTLGQSDLNSSSEVFINNLNGSSFSTGNLFNNLIGGWAVANGSNNFADSFATYNSTLGVGSLGETGFAGYDGTNITVLNFGTSSYNVSDVTAGTRAITASSASNSWRLAPTAAETITLSSGVSLTFGVGIITNANFAITINGADATPTITTSGGGDLYIYVNQNTTTIGVQITGVLNLVKGAAGTLTLSPAASNNYSGATYVQAGTLTLSAATAGIVTVPNDLIVNNAAVTFGTLIPGQIGATSNIALNGGGALTLPNYTSAAGNTFASLSFNSTGGSATPTFSFGVPKAQSTVILTAANAILSINDDDGFTPTITTSAATLSGLQLSNAAPVITTSGASPMDLVIAVPITSAGGPITKAGAGSLVLSGASTFTTGFDLSAGTLIVGNASALGSGPLAISGGTTIQSATAVVNLGNAVTVNGNFAFGGALAVNGVTLSGAINFGNAAPSITVTNPLVTDTLSGQIIGAGSGLTKSGAGTLILSNIENAATFDTTGSQAIVVAGGILQIQGATGSALEALGITPTSVVADNIVINGGVLNFSPTATIATLSANRGILIGSATGSGSGAIGVSGSDTVIYGGVIANNGVGSDTLYKVGAGVLALTGVNTYTGTTTISAGTLQIGSGGSTGALGSGAVTDNGTLAFDRIDNYGGPLSNVINGSGGLTLRAGALTLDQTNTYSGATTVSGGTLTLDFSQPGAPATNIISSSSALALGGGTLSVIGNAGTTNSQTFAGLTLNVGASSISDLNSATANPTLIALGAISRNSGSTVNFILPTTPGSAANGITTSTANTNGILDGWATVGQDWATNNGTNIVAYSGYYTTTTGGNTASSYLAQNVQVNSAPTFTGVVTPNSFDFANTTAFTVTLATGTNIIDSGGILVSSAATAAATVTGGTLTSGNGQDLIVIQNSAQNLNIGSVIVNNGATPIGLTKTGPGLLNLSAANTYTGTTYILAGAIQLGIANALPTGTSVILGDAGTNTGGTLDLDGFNQLLLTLSSAGSGQSIVTNSSTTAATLQFAGTGVFGGSIQDGARAGGVSVTVYGGASATFTGANTYTGQTLIQNATLILAGTGSTLSASDKVELNNGSGTGGVLQLGNATAGGANQTLGALIIGAGTTNRVVGGNATQTSVFTINNSAADLFPGYLGSGTADSTAVTAANDLALTKTGSGTFTLGNGATTTTLSTYDGGTNVNQGTLALGIANALPAANTLAFGSGTLTSGAVNINGGTLDLAGFSSVAGAVTLNGGSIIDSVGGGTLSGSSYAVQSGSVSAALGGAGSALTKTTAGNVTLSGANTYTGGTAVSAGTLVVNGSIAGTSNVNVGGGTNPAALTVNGSITSAAGLNLANNGSLSGTGTINGAVTAGAGSTLAPGVSSAGLTINGALNLQAGSTLQLSIANSNATTEGAPALTDYSKLTLGTGVSATIAGTIVANVTGTLNHLDLFTIILSQTPVSGVFANATFVSGNTYAFTSDGEDFEINYAYDGSTVTSPSEFASITSGSDVALLVLPEPNSFTMLFGSLVVALGLQRFRRRRS
jgi:autotransporter-associated beta strand protein